MTQYSHTSLSHLPLGKTTEYPTQYTPQLLQPVPRQLNRDTLGLTNESLPFSHGADIWTLYELSWLNMNGLPQVAIGEVHIDHRSVNLVESKSFKLYLNSFNQSKFSSIEQVQQRLEQDLCTCAQGNVIVKLYALEHFTGQAIRNFDGVLIDQQNITIDDYQFTPEILVNCANTQLHTSEKLVSHLLKSNCLITNQPDWGSIQIEYMGAKINQEQLLRYLVSFRNHNEFHEQCVERIFCDLMHYAKPEKLCVYARYTRRGGLDINPYRANYSVSFYNHRLARQ